MTEPPVLAELRARDIRIRADGDKLQLDAPTGALTPELGQQLRQHKTEILEFLREPAEASFSQQRLWFLDQFGAGGAVYVIPCGVGIRGALHASVLEGALETVVNRHDSLRTIFTTVEGRPLQVVSKPRPWTLPVVDLSSTTEARLRLAHLMREEAARGFDLTRGPLFRAVLYRLGPDEHVLLLLQHHIISDAWSVDVLLRELGTLYRDRVSGGPSALAELPVQYRDFSRSQRDRLQGEVLTRQLEYWRSHLKGAPQVLHLPTDRSRPPTESHRGATYSFFIPRAVSDGLGDLSRHEGATLFMVLMTAFDVLLWRYTGQEDLLVGTPVANRGRTELEGLIGQFVNTLVLRSDLSGNPTVREMLARVRELCLDAYAHQELPFETLVQSLRPERDMSRNPLYQVMLVLQNLPQQPFAAPGLTVTPLEVDRGAAHLDLTLYVQETPQGLRGTFEYATDLFEETTIARMARHWRTLLEAMIATPGCRLLELPLLTDTERQQLLVGVNSTNRDYARKALTQELFEAQTARAPDRTALRFGALALSYAELDARANCLAHMLRSRGVGRGQRVGLCMERSAEMLAAVLGILKAGAAYVPLDPSFPEERLRFMAEDAQLALLVSTAALAGVFGLPRERQLLLDTDAGSLASQPDQRLTPDAALDARPEDPAYVIYTSGSTGKPKGVVVPHRAVVNFLTSMARVPGLAADDVLVAVTTLSFDIAVLELQLPLTVGATVVIASRDEAVDGHVLKGLLEQHRATVMQATPVTWRLLLEAGWQGEKGFKALVGGETLPKDLADQLIACGVELWNLYGPTETTVWSTCARITDTANGISIGRPIANTTVYVLDAQNNLCPIGVPGELCIGGVGVTLGYWKRPELTAERFIPDPFSTAPGATLYRTGDRARWRNDGTLEHLGRLDFQVKIRGFRIELGEIETNIANHPAVRETVVIAREDVPGDQRLEAYVVPRNGEITAAALRQHLSLRLPPYMVPSAFVMCEALPRTPNAKIDRKALPAPEHSGSEATYIAPRSPMEEVVAANWRKAFQLQRVGIHDDFFELGGHSLMFARMISEINSTFKSRLGMAELIQNPTVEQFAKLIDTQQPLPSKLSSLVSLQVGRAELPVYFIYAGSGELRLAQHMAGSHSVFGIEARWPMAWRNAVSDNQTSAFPTMEQMVAPYVAELSAHTRSTPCVLAGFCYAGLIAFEAARQLHKLGGKVELVVLIDTAIRPPNRYQLAWQIWRQAWKPPKEPTTDWDFQSLSSRMRATWDTTSWLLGRVAKRLRSYFNRPQLDTTLTGVLDEQGMPVSWGLLARLYGEMAKTYTLRSLNSRGVLFRTGELDGKQLAYASDDALGWENLFTQGLEIIPVAGHHFSIWGTQIPSIAKEINRVLAQRSPE